MKTAIKTLPVIILLLLGSTDTFAQYGFKAGINIPNVTVDRRTFTPPEIENKIGFNIGAFINVKNYTNFSIESGLTFERKMIKGKGFATFSNTSAEMMVDYLIYSVTGKYTFLENEKTSPYLFISPRLNFYLGNDYTSSPELSQSSKDIISDKMKKVGFGTSIGGGLEIMRDNDVIPFFEVQFSPDFFNAYDSPDLKFKSNSIEALLGIRFK
jgi:hypothetical protein